MAILMEIAKKISHEKNMVSIHGGFNAAGWLCFFRYGQ